MKNNVKGDSRLTSGEAVSEAADSKQGGGSEPEAGQALMSTGLFSYSSFFNRLRSVPSRLIQWIFLNRAGAGEKIQIYGSYVPPRTWKTPME